MIARPRNPPVPRKSVRDISRTSRVIADFVHVAMATGVGRGKNFFLASFNSPTPKTPCYTQISPGYLLYKPSDADFVPNFVAMATGVSRRRICLASSNSPTPKPLLYAKISEISLI